MSGTARIEKPKPVNPCSMAEITKIREPMIKKCMSIILKLPFLNFRSFKNFGSFFMN